jgi:hypothetical protein
MSCLHCMYAPWHQVGRHSIQRRQANVCVSNFHAPLRWHNGQLQPGRGWPVQIVVIQLQTASGVRTTAFFDS